MEVSLSPKSSDTHTSRKLSPCWLSWEEVAIRSNQGHPFLSQGGIFPKSWINFHCGSFILEFSQRPVSSLKCIYWVAHLKEQELGWLWYPGSFYWLRPLGLYCWLTLSTTPVPTDLPFLSLSAHPLSFAIGPEPQPPLTLAQPCPLPASILLYYTEVYSLPWWLACLWAKSFQSYPILCDPIDYSPRGFCVHGILQARTLEWVAVPSFRGSSPPRDGTCISCSFCIAGGFFIIEPLRTTNWVAGRACFLCTQKDAFLAPPGFWQLPSVLGALPLWPHCSCRSHLGGLLNTSLFLPVMLSSIRFDHHSSFKTQLRLGSAFSVDLHLKPLHSNALSQLRVTHCTYLFRWLSSLMGLWAPWGVIHIHPRTWDLVGVHNVY